MVIDPGAQDSNLATLDGQVGAPVGAPTWLSPRVLADLVDRCRRTEQMSAIEVSLICYLDRLDEALFADGSADDTDSPVSYCGCADCQAREILAHLVPPLADLITCQLHTHPVPRPGTPVGSLIPVPRPPKECPP
jgi:hypothetical protein